MACGVHVGGFAFGVPDGQGVDDVGDAGEHFLLDGVGPGVVLAAEGLAPDQSEGAFEVGGAVPGAGGQGAGGEFLEGLPGRAGRSPERSGPPFSSPRREPPSRSTSSACTDPARRHPLTITATAPPK